MPKKPKQQFFVVTVQRMTTCDEADIITQWTGVVAQKGLSKVRLEDIANALAAPTNDDNGLFTNTRPMTKAEIKAYRDDQ